MKFVSYWRHNSTGAFCVWVKALGDDFSTESTKTAISSWPSNTSDVWPHGVKILRLIYDTPRVEDLPSPCKSLRIKYNSNVVLSDFIL